jgi:hypothetical protein
MTTNWYEKHDNVVLLTWWMAQNDFPATEVAYAVEKPWKFEEEFNKAKEES